MSEKETAKRNRSQMTEFGMSLKSFVRSVHPGKLALKVGVKINEPDSEKVQVSINNMIRQANLSQGVLSVRRRDLVDAVLESVVELDSDQSLKRDRLAKSFQYEAIPSANRDSGKNWLVKLKAGEEIKVIDGPDGDGYYKLVFSRNLGEDESVEDAVCAESEEAVELEEAGV